jgi:hypothetical protein
MTLLEFFGSVLALGAALVAWGTFLHIVSRILVGESDVFRRGPRALVSIETWAEAALSPHGRIAAALFIAGAASVAGGVLTLIYAVASTWVTGSG